MDSNLRELNAREKGLIEKLLDAAPRGCEELRTQLGHTKAREIIEDGTLILECTGGTPSKYRTPVAEGVCKDADGADIAVILHLGKSGFLSMLEIIKYDGSKIVSAPSAEYLAVNHVPLYRILGPGKVERIE